MVITSNKIMYNVYLFLTMLLTTSTFSLSIPGHKTGYSLTESQLIFPIKENIDKNADQRKNLEDIFTNYTAVGLKKSFRFLNKNIQNDISTDPNFIKVAVDLPMTPWLSRNEERTIFYYDKKEKDFYIKLPLNGEVMPTGTPSGYYYTIAEILCPFTKGKLKSGVNGLFFYTPNGVISKPYGYFINPEKSFSPSYPGVAMINFEGYQILTNYPELKNQEVIRNPVYVPDEATLNLVKNAGCDAEIKEWNYGDKEFSGEGNGEMKCRNALGDIEKMMEEIKKNIDMLKE